MTNLIESWLLSESAKLGLSLDSRGTQAACLRELNLQTHSRLNGGNLHKWRTGFNAPCPETINYMIRTVVQMQPVTGQEINALTLSIPIKGRPKCFSTDIQEAIINGYSQVIRTNIGE